MTESALQSKVLRTLRQRGGLWDNNWGGPWTQSGRADITGCVNGKFVAIELKAPGKYKNPKEGLTPNQWRYIRMVADNGGLAIVSDNLDEIIVQVYPITISKEVQ